jgi:predicted nuclease with TOPRIM domain
LKYLASILLATGITVTGVAWLGSEDLTETKEVIDKLVGHVENLVSEKNELKEDLENKKAYITHLEKDLTKANEEAESLREYAEQQLKCVEGKVNGNGNGNAYGHCKGDKQ